jgi:2-amino-4-hydroxy-6-hydroxymethyldihydropteridine diphosphokinase
MVEWADTMQLEPPTRAMWRDAGLWHDALRGAPEESLGPPAVDPTLPAYAWHGPAAADRLRAEGETRTSLLDAITWHTLGDSGWDLTGRALFCADYLDPSRDFARSKRKAWARRFPSDPDGVLRRVLRMRIERALAEREEIHPRTIALWEVVR